VSIVSNTGPLIALAKIDHLELIRSLYQTAFIPVTVAHEVFAKPSADAARVESAIQANIIEIQTQQQQGNIVSALAFLGAGERDAILLASALSLPLIVDDRAARQAARAVGVTVTGTAGVLIEAKRTRLLVSVRSALEQIRRNGYWLSDELVEAASKLSGE
jgi:predicted nucleic acid-binding protein